MYDFLKKVPFFADLPHEDLERLCQMVEEVSLPAGEELFGEGSAGDRAYVIEEGQIEIVKQSGGREVLLAVRQSGEVIGEMSLIEAAPRNATARARTNSLLIAITQEQLEQLLNNSPSAARAMLHTFISRLRATDIMLRHSEKMAQLGTMTAGIAHELNNPAAAARRGAEQLRSAVSRLQTTQLVLSKLGLDQEHRQILLDLDQMARQAALQPSDLDSLGRSDREFELETWLSEHGLENGWEIAPSLVSLGYEPEGMEDLANKFSQQRFPAVLEWLCAVYTIYSLLEEIDRGAGRISEIVKSLKVYVYLDQAPVQSVDIHEGLDNTLIMLRSKLKGGINVQREYADHLPKIQAYGSELNQVWTNLIDNAVDAMDNKGEIILRTRQEDQWVVVEVEDTGPGIPAEIRSKIYDPFFTTKPPGKGTGLGLNITFNIIQKHMGEIKVFSQPGKTLFQVWLPLNFEALQQGSSPAKAIKRPDDAAILDILQTSRNIAVVGITDRKDLPSFSVPAYLQANAYCIYPVNPKIEAVLGERAYPDLSSIADSIDVVLIFRRNEAIPKIVEEAIQIGAKTVWMQEGVIHEEAALTAQRAGLNVVMDTCMRAQHKRLIKNAKIVMNP